MREFTFVMLTYNQEQYVLEHLESIKYQIETYGRNIAINFILADDSSNDKTVYKVKKWLEINRHLFFSTEFLVANINQGIVINYISALKSIKTKYYKILAGDDIYYKNNIFEIYSSGYDIYLTPVIRFSDKKVELDRSRWFYVEMLYQQYKNNNIKNFLSNSLKYSMNIESPGLFMVKTALDNGIYKELQKFHYIEDVPLINYLLKKERLKILVLDKPYILYRINSGISTNKSHLKYNTFISELEKLDKEIFVKKRKNKYLNSFEYKYRIKLFLYNYNLLKWYNKKIQKFKKNIKMEENVAIKYLHYLKMKGSLLEEKC